MRSIFSILGLLVTLAVIALVAKKQLTALPTADLTPLAPSQQIPGQLSSSPSIQSTQQKYKEALDAAMQPARREAEEK